MATLIGQPNRQQQLEQLAQRLPFENQTSSAPLRSQQTANLQQQVASTPRGASSPQAAQQLGSQQALQQGQITLQSANQLGAQRGQLGQAGLQMQQQQGNEALNQMQLGLVKKERQLSNDLFNYNRSLKNELFDKQMQFSKDDLGRTSLNERQLADYAMLKARGAEDMRNYEQKVRQFSNRRMELLKASYKKVQEELERDFKSGQQELDQESRQQLAIAKANLEKKIREEAAAAANRAGMLGAAGTIAGGVIGAVYGGPAGAAVGAQAGGALGNMVASRT